MTYREKIRLNLEAEGQRGERARALLDTLTDTYDAGGDNAVTDAVSETMRGFEEQFQARLEALEKTF
ncbi:MAG: hypothetical protein VB861_06805 [Planctomycetaceae bacterium]